jgi:anaerobic selenocysteine-containing dehydrogenase
VAQRAGVAVEDFTTLIDTFARAKRGPAMTATGPDMGPHSNLAEHLVYCLNVVCGRFVREGEKILNPGVILPRYPRPCQVVPAPRPWDQGFKSRVGDYGMIWGELPTGIMADEILKPGPGRVRVMINHGGNPATSVPDQRKVVKALNSLDLLVSMEPYMTPTAKLSHYILPPVLQYERPDLPLWLYEYILYPEPFTRYTPAVANPPEGAEVAEDGYIYWALAKRLGIPMRSCGVEMDMSRPPTADELLATVAQHVPMAFADVQRHEMGTAVDVEPQFAEPGNPGPDDKFTLMPKDVLDEIKLVAREDFVGPIVLKTGEQATFRTAVRRSRDRFNSTCGFLSGVRKRAPYNTLLMNPDDMKELNLVDGDYARVASDNGVIRLIAETDDTLRRGVVSIIHGFGDLPDADNYLERGISPNLLISTDRDLQDINATPRMTAVPVAIRATN